MDKPDSLVEIGISSTKAKDGTYLWWYQCGCGKVFTALKRYVKKGRTVSCGCYRKSGGSLPGLGKSPTNKLPERQRTINYTWASYISSARTKGLVFRITRIDFAELIFSDCYYCGAPPGRYRATAKESTDCQIPSNGIDRINNDEGYILENVVSCCTDCNFLKGARNQKDFLAHICRIASGGAWTGRIV